jgi:hypothetical protein
MNVIMVAASRWTLYTLSTTEIKVSIDARCRALYALFTIVVGLIKRTNLDAWILYNLPILFFAHLFK